MEIRKSSNAVDFQTIVRNFYDQIAEYYDLLMRREDWHDVDNSRGADWLIEYLKSVQNVTRVLDCGCGTGIHTARILQEGYEVVGCDLSKEMLNRARSNLQNHLPNLTPRFVECDFNDLTATFRDAEFDAVVCAGGGILHISNLGALTHILEGMSRILRPGGICILEFDDLKGFRTPEAKESVIFHLEQIEASKEGELIAFDRWKVNGSQLVSRVVIVEKVLSYLRTREFELPLTILSEKEVLKGMNETGFEKVRIQVLESGRAHLSSLLIVADDNSVATRRAIAMIALRSPNR